MTSLQRIPCSVIAGFLDAGKTTLVRNLLQESKGKQFSIIVNEFCDDGIDREILRKYGVENCTDEDIVELVNDCICCTVSDDFVSSLDKIPVLKPCVDHILIETSGLALPKPLVQAFHWLEDARLVVARPRSLSSAVSLAGPMATSSAAGSEAMSGSVR